MVKNKIRDWRKGNLFLGISVLLLLLIMIIAVAIGGTYITPKEVYKVLLYKLTNGVFYKEIGNTMIESIIWEIRLPRVLLGAIGGAGLALCGVLMQCVTKNPIAEPYILGLSSGASCGAVAVIVLGGMASVGITSVTMGAFIGSILTGGLVLTIGTQMGRDSSTIRLVLSGMAISTIFSALTNLLIYAAKNTNQAKTALFWTVGSLGGAKWEVLLLPSILLAIVMIITLYISKSLDLLLVGDQSAVILGMNIKLMKGLVLVLSTLLTSALIAVTGSIGFIGLVVPHIGRTLVGNDHKKLVLFSSLMGAIFLIGSDMIARGLFPPLEIPIGIITALVGGPFFLYLIAKRNYSFGGSE